MTPASLSWEHPIVALLKAQSISRESSNVQETKLPYMTSFPLPKVPPRVAMASERNHMICCILKSLISLYLEYPSCLHTTEASSVPHPREQTVCHLSWEQISTRPSLLTPPSWSLTSPSTQKTEGPMNM